MSDREETMPYILEELRSGEYAPLADRIEAAHQKDVARLRKALCMAQVALKVCDWPEGVDMDGVETLMREIEDTLAETEDKEAK